MAVSTARSRVQAAVRTRRPSQAPRVARLSDTEVRALDHRIEPWPGHYEVLRDTQLYVRPTPSTRVGAEPALYLHGLGGSSVNWTDLAHLLGDHLDGEALDLPGFGRSGPAPDRDYSIPNFARLVIAHLERRDRGPVHLFGNSMGGAVSLQVASHRPDLVRTLTLISPAVPDLRPRVRPDAAMTLLLVPGIRTLLQQRAGKVTAEQRARALVRLVYADEARLPAHRLAEAIADAKDREHLPWAADAFTRSLRGLVVNYATLGRRSAWQQMTSITAPTLVVWGAHDRLVDVALAPRVARTIPGARLLVLPDVGHVAQLEDPEITARAVLALLADASATATATTTNPVAAGDPISRRPRASHA